MRNETAKVERRAGAGKSGTDCHANRISPSLPLLRRQKPVGKPVASCSINRQLPLDPKSCALEYFHVKYVTASRFDYLRDWLRSPTPDLALRRAMTSAALAVFHIAHAHLSLWQEACKEYILALEMVNAALTCPGKMLRDELLVSILLLGLFEALSNQGSCNTHHNNWGAHFRGAGRLLCLRGLAQLDTELGQQIFVQVSAGILMFAAESREQLPANFATLLHHATNYLKGPNIRWRLRSLQLVDCCATLRTRIETSPTEDTIGLVKEAVALDRQIVAHIASIPWQQSESKLEHESVNMSKPQDLWPYSAARTSQFLDSLAMLRMLLNETIYWKLNSSRRPIPSTAAGVDDRSLLTAHEGMLVAARNTEDMAVRIYNRLSLAAMESLVATGSPRIWEGFSSLWPLSVVGASCLVPPELRRLALEKIDCIGKRMQVLTLQCSGASIQENARCVDDSFDMDLF